MPDLATSAFCDSFLWHGMTMALSVGSLPETPLTRHLVVAHHAAHRDASIGQTVSSLVRDAGRFFSQLADLSWPPLIAGLALFALYLLLRSRALLSAIRAAYPDARVRWREVWGAYMVGYSISCVFPLSAGNVAQLFLTRISIEGASYPTLAAAISTGTLFDWGMGLLVMVFAFTQGVFPKPPDFSKLPAFDISFFASHMRFTLFLMTAVAVLFLLLFAWLSVRVRAFWLRVKQGYAILGDRRRYRRQMASWQLASWVARFGSYWFLLQAFHIGGSVRNALLVLGVQVVSSVFPFTPGGAGVQQALLLKIFAGSAYVASFSVGQQIATDVISAALGFAALVLIFRLRSFREALRRGRADQQRAALDDAAPVAFS